MIGDIITVTVDRPLGSYQPQKTKLYSVGVSMLLERWFKKMGLAVNSDFVEVKNGT